MRHAPLLLCLAACGYISDREFDERAKELGFADADTDTDTDTDADADADSDADVDSDVDVFGLGDTGWGEPVTPTKGSYPLGVRCNAIGPSGGLVWIGLCGTLLGFAIRRRA